MLYYKACNMKIISGSKGHRERVNKRTTFCDADIWAAPVRTNACSSCTKGCMLPGRSQSTGASKQGKRTMYGSGIVPLLCCLRRSDKIWNMYGTNSAKIIKEHITCTSTYTEIHLVKDATPETLTRWTEHFNYRTIQDIFNKLSHPNCNTLQE